jgi:predicted acetyltransferase
VIWKPRVIDADELPKAIDITSVAFGVGQKAPASYAAACNVIMEVDRTFVVDDGPVLAGTAGAFTFDMAVPGGAALPMTSVTEVSVLPTHRRRGALNALMGAVIDQGIERGEALAGLTASEGTIYRRYGFGVATRSHAAVFETDRASEVVDVAAPGSVRFVDEVEAVTLLPAVWERSWRRLPGEVGRKESWWTALALDPEDDRDGASARFVVTHEDTSGAPDGVAVYRFKHGDAARPGYELQIHDMAAADDAVEAALLRFLLDVDLVRTVRWHAAPLDLPLKWRLTDPRAVKVERERDHLWLRVLDVARCLSARTYATEGTAVIEVVDPSRPELGGTFRLDAGPDGAECTPTTSEPDVVVDVPTLGALYLGDVSWTTLRRAGLVAERTDGATTRLDALFRPERAPCNATDF